MRVQEVNTRTGLSKVEQYKWIIKGVPGELAWLSKHVLQVDHAYQRIAKDARVLKLARRWNWLACGVLTVALRGDVYYVVEGQHRLLAALRRNDIERLPCVVFRSVSVHDEAVAFRDANKERRPLNTFEQWNADLVAADEPTVFAQALITQAGRVPAATAGPGLVRCLSALVAAARQSREELVRVWPLAVQLCEGHALHERVFGALMYLECNLDGQSVAGRPWRERCVRIGYKGMLDASQRAAAFYAKGGPKVWALGVMQELNKGMRTNQLTLRQE